MENFEKEVNITRKLTFSIRENPGYDPTVTDEIVIREIFDDNVYQVHPDDVRDGIVLDIGANIGIFSIYASLLGAKQVLAFEPEDENRALLLLNARLNHIGNIKVSARAVSSKEEEFEIYKAQGATKRTEYEEKLLEGVEKQKVKSLGINEIMDELGEVAVLKIDCEGGEYPIFKAVTTDNLKKIKYITGEFHKATEEDYGAMMAKLSLSHNVHIFGHYDRGGQFYAKRY